MKTLKDLSIIFLSIFILFTNTSLLAGWSTPQIVVAEDGVQPSIATDGNGNSIAVWYTDSEVFQAATLQAGAVNGLGQPLWVPTNDITTDIHNSFNPIIQSVGMDNNGNALVAWADSTQSYIYISRLPFGQTTWSTPLQINIFQPGITVTDPYIAVNARGDAIVSWATLVPSTSYQYHLWSNAYNSRTNSWQGAIELWGTTVEYDSDVNPVAIDARGNGVAVIGNSDQTSSVQPFSYNLSTNLWTVINPIPITYNDQVITTVAVTPGGDAAIIAINLDASTVTAYTLLFNQTTVTNPTVLSTTADLIFNVPVVQADALGGFLTVWADNTTALGSARYSLLSRQWQVLPLLALDQPPEIITLAVDAIGNGVATWTAGGLTTFSIPTIPILSAVLGYNNNAWNLLTQVSTDNSNENAFSRVVITTQGDAVAVWETGLAPGLLDVSDFSPSSISSSISSSIFLNLFPLLPVNFQGKLIKNKFLSQTSFKNVLSWSTSPSPNVVSYNLYRNGTLIATIPNNGSSFTYTDANQRKPYVYTLVAINNLGYSSAPTTIVVR